LGQEEVWGKRIFKEGFNPLIGLIRVQRTTILFAVNRLKAKEIECTL